MWNMNDYVDKKIKVLTDGGRTMEGIVMGHTTSFVLLKVASDKPAVRIPKRKIESFQPMDEEVTDSDLVSGSEMVASSKESILDNMKVLACQNEKSGCKGVKYIKLMKGEPKESDFEEMIYQCPKRNANCKMGCLGNISEVSPQIISNVLNQTLYGEYPKSITPKVKT